MDCQAGNPLEPPNQERGFSGPELGFEQKFQAVIESIWDYAIFMLILPLPPHRRLLLSTLHSRRSSQCARY